MKKKCIVVDLEGTLTNSDHRKHFLGERPQSIPDYDMWNEGLMGDKPEKKIIDVLISLQEDFTIVISSAKPNKYLKDIDSWLDRHAPDLNINQMWLRKEGDMRTSPEVKKDHIGHIEEQYKIVCFIDDRFDILEMVGEKCIRAIHPAEYINIPSILDAASAKMTVADSLRKSADIFEDRNKDYGAAYKDFGPILKGYFPGGIHIEKEEDMNRFAMFIIILAKTQRYANNFFKGGHADSLVDMSTYCAMLNELDSEL